MHFYGTKKIVFPILTICFCQIENCDRNFNFFVENCLFFKTEKKSFVDLKRFGSNIEISFFFCAKTLENLCEFLFQN